MPSVVTSLRSHVLPVLVVLVVLVGTTACLPHAPAAEPGPRSAVAAQAPAALPHALAPLTPAPVAPESSEPLAAPASLPFTDVPRAPVLSPEARGAAALATLGYDPVSLGWTVAFRSGRPGYLGLAHPDRRHIDVFVRRGQSDASVRATLAHEIGHAVDLTYGDDDRRAQWLRLRGIDAAVPWFGCHACADHATGAGDFAEVFALWLTGPADFRSRLARAPTDQQLADLVPLFAAPTASPAPAPSRTADDPEAPRDPAGRPGSSAPPSPRPSPTPSPCLVVLRCP